MADPVTSPADTHILSDDARALHPGGLDAHTVTAEALLGVRGSSYSGDDLDVATLAVAHQINFQVARPSIFRVLESESKGSQSVTYRIPEYGSRASLLDETAVGLIDSLKAGSWATVRSRR